MIKKRCFLTINNFKKKKTIGVTEVSENESENETANLNFRVIFVFSGLEVDVDTFDIDIAHQAHRNENMAVKSQIILSCTSCCLITN